MLRWSSVQVLRVVLVEFGERHDKRKRAKSKFVKNKLVRCGNKLYWEVVSQVTRMPRGNWFRGIQLVTQ